MTRKDPRLTLDEWFPTLVRYAGFGLTIFASLDPTARAPIFVPAAGMILYKTVRSVRERMNGDDDEK